MKQKNKALFVLEKWCDGIPNLGLTNNFHNLLNTFSQSRPECKFNTLHIDESSVVYKTHLDDILPKYCLQWTPDVIFYSLLGQSPWNPSLKTYQIIKEMGIYQCFHWPDTGPGWGIQTIQSLGSIPDLHISWDNPRSAFHASVPKIDNLLYLWVPQDSSLYFSDEKTIDVSFIGSARYPDRAYFINELQKNVPNFVFAGGQREQKLSPEQYASLIRKSKIGINFSASPAGFSQTKGRIFEILASNSLLLESSNPATESLFKPNQEYVPFGGVEDLINKIQYYLSHEEERASIARAGFEAFNNKFTAQIFWDRIMEKVNE